MVLKDDVEKYISQFPADVQVILRKIRTVIKSNVPDAEEKIAYGMPCYKTHKKPLIYFAAFKNHIGIYAIPLEHIDFKDELSKYKQGKGSVQFPIDQPIPYDLIERIVKFKVAENEKKAEGRVPFVPTLASE